MNTKFRLQAGSPQTLLGLNRNVLPKKLDLLFNSGFLGHYINTWPTVDSTWTRGLPTSKVCSLHLAKISLITWTNTVYPRPRPIYGLRPLSFKDQMGGFWVQGRPKYDSEFIYMWFKNILRHVPKNQFWGHQSRCATLTLFPHILNSLPQHPKFPPPHP